MKRFLVAAVATLAIATSAQAQITRIEIPLGQYGEHTVDGRRAVLVPGSHVETHFGRVELPRLNGQPDNVLFTRITPTGEFKICGQSHAGAGTYEWAHGEWHIVGPSFGVNACIYDYANRLHIGEQRFGTQGFRWANVDNSIVLGDLTYADPERKVWEFTTYGDTTIGQGENGCVSIRGAERRLIEPGHCTFVRYTREGDRLAATFVKLLERKTVLLTLGVSDLAAFPLDGPPVVVVPDPDPEPVECGEVPQRGQILLQQLWARPDVNALVRGDDEQRRRAARMFAEQLAFSVDRAWGTKRADPGRPPSKDAITRDIKGTLCNWDIVNGSTRELAFGRGEEIPGQVFIPVDPIDHLGAGVTPDPDPEPDPQLDVLKARIKGLEAEKAALLEANETFKRSIGDLNARLNTLTEELAATQAELTLRKTSPCDFVTIQGSGFIRTIFGIRCEAR